MAQNLISVLLILALVSLGRGEFKLSNIYSDGMVLQATKDIHFWGIGEPGSIVQLTYELEQTSNITQDDGIWRINALGQSASLTPHNFTFQETSTQISTITLNNVMFGDVWVCSGQSNMEMKMNEIFNATEEIEFAASYTNIRVLQVGTAVSELELNELSGITMKWGAIDSQTIGEFSAACLLYGERMSDRFNGQRPIGLIEASYKGTRIEAWVSKRVLRYCNTPPSSEVVPNRNADNGLWNAMIHPLTKMAVRGAIWFQGENNVGYNTEYYNCHLQQLWTDWKNTFIEGNVKITAENDLAFPFGVFQLGPNYNVGTNTARWCSLRWHQTADLGILPNSFLPEGFLASTYDLTDWQSPTSPIHPRDKQTTTTRLANAAKAFLYGDNYLRNGPVAESFTEISPGLARITYNMDITVKANDAFFYSVTPDVWENAVITETSGRNVTVSFDPAANQLAYGWAVTICEYKQCAIYSTGEEALPANVWLWQLNRE